jgi:hypothetical protein
LPEGDSRKSFSPRASKVRGLLPILTNIVFLELKFPEYVGNELRSSNETLFSDKEIFLLLDYERGSKNKVWNNFFNLIGEDKYY